MDRLLRYMTILCWVVFGWQLSFAKPLDFQASPTNTGDLILVGIVDGTIPGGDFKFLEFYAVNDIADMSIYGVGTANNGGGSDGVEWSFPAVPISQGTSFYLARDSATFADYFGFNARFIDGGVVTNFNGNDAVELFENAVAVDVYGDVAIPGDGEVWEFTDGWARRKDSTGPDGATFVAANWIYSGVDALENATNSTMGNPPYPLDPFEFGGGTVTSPQTIELVLKGIIDGPTTPMRATEYEVIADIPDLSVYGMGSAQNGNGTNGIEWTFPAVPAFAGDRLYVARDSATFREFFGFDADFIDPVPDAHNFNGDDAIEVFKNGVLIEVFGDQNTDGTGEPWEYTDGWAHRKDGTGPDSATFVLSNWEFSPNDNFDGQATNAGSPLPYPVFQAAKTRPDLVLVGLIHGSATVKATEYYVLEDIPDLSIYGVGCANNGNGTDSVEYTFPAVAASKGDRLYVARDSADFRAFFGFDATFFDPSSGGAHNFNGDDAFELFENGIVIDVFGEINTDGSGEPWEYSDTWAQRNCATGPDSSTFVLSNWTIGTLGTFDVDSVNSESADPYPVETYLPTPCGTPGGGTDLVMTEIMYNSPGTDLEYLEFYNNTANPIDMTGYSISDAVNYTFPAFTLQPGAYVLVSDDSVGMQSFWGVSSFQWTSGSLNNGGEPITLIDATNTVVDSVRYDDAAPWTTTPDGRGPALVLCDPNSDNNVGSNWQRATTSSGKLFDGREVFGNPGDTAVCLDNPIVAIQRAEVLTGEADGDLTVLFYIDNPDMANATSVDIAIVGGNADANDYSFTPSTITFPAGTDTAQSIVVGITDDGDQEPEESFTLRITNPTNGAIITNDTLQIKIIDNDAPITNGLTLVGLIHGPNSGVPKAVEILATEDIPNLSLFGLGCANNGQGSDGQEYTFPPVSIAAGTCFFVSNDTAAFRSFFGFGAAFQDGGSANNFNGNDAYEIFESGVVIDVFGEIDADGTGTPWEYTLGWAHRKPGTGPDSATFVLDNWEFSDLEEFVGFATNAEADDPYPFGMCQVGVSVDGNVPTPKISLYPNPATHLVSFETTLSMQQVDVLNRLGQQVWSQANPARSGTLDLSNLGPGLYLVRFSDGNTTWTEKLLIRH